MMPSKSLLARLPYFRVACPRVRVRASVWLPDWGPSLSVPNSGEHSLWTRVLAQHSRWMVYRYVDGDLERSRIFGSFAPLLIPSRSSLPLADEAKDGREAKAIFVVSDGTGWTAEQADAARRQFPQSDRLCPMDTFLFSGIDGMERLMDIIGEADKEKALLLYTFADPAMAEAAENTCTLLGVPSAKLSAPGMVLDRCKRLGEGRRHGGDTAVLQQYEVFVRKPDIVFAGPEERDAWYRSFFGVDECRNLFFSDSSFGIVVWLTKEEFCALMMKEGFLQAMPCGKEYCFHTPMLAVG